MVIRRSLDLFMPQKSTRPVEKRALTSEQIRQVAALEDVKITTRHDPQRDMARDVFMISFLTMGTNTIDLYGCEYDAEGNITYERAKVREIRADRAKIVIKPHPLLYPIWRNMPIPMPRMTVVSSASIPGTRIPKASATS